MFKSILPVIICLVQLHTTAYSTEKLDVHVLYESLCPDSIKFLQNQLYPVWKELSPYVNIKFVPFGKSASLEKGSAFICQHGPRECIGNRIQSCALNALQDQDLQVEYVHCFMSIYKKNQEDPNEFGQSCATKVGVSWESVLQCNDSPLGTALQLDAEQITAQITPKFVPTILYNGQFNQQTQDDSQVNFRGVVCQLITPTYPHACQQEPKTADSIII